MGDPSEPIWTPSLVRDPSPVQRIGVHDYDSLTELLRNTWTRLYDSPPRDPQDIIQHMEATILEYRKQFMRPHFTPSKKQLFAGGLLYGYLKALDRITRKWEEFRDQMKQAWRGTP
jgi:hypothetical protein